MSTIPTKMTYNVIQITFESGWGARLQIPSVATPADIERLRQMLDLIISFCHPPQEVKAEVEMEAEVA